MSSQFKVYNQDINLTNKATWGEQSHLTETPTDFHDANANQDYVNPPK